jgi:hypothetical protein
VSVPCVCLYLSVCLPDLVCVLCCSCSVRGLAQGVVPGVHAGRPHRVHVALRQEVGGEMGGEVQGGEVRRALRIYEVRGQFVGGSSVCNVDIYYYSLLA